MIEFSISLFAMMQAVYSKAQSGYLPGGPQWGLAELGVLVQKLPQAEQLLQDPLQIPHSHCALQLKPHHGHVLHLEKFLNKVSQCGHIEYVKEDFYPKHRKNRAELGVLDLISEYEYLQKWKEIKF